VRYDLYIYRSLGIKGLSDDWSAPTNELASHTFIRAALLCTAFAAVVSRGNGKTRVITMLYLVDLDPSDQYVVTFTKISCQNVVYYGHATRSRQSWIGGERGTTRHAMCRKHQFTHPY